jgi:hypothetical protein
MLVLATHRSGVPVPIATHPALRHLLESTSTALGQAAGTLGVLVSRSGEVTLGATLADRPGALVLLRYAVERAWMCGVPGLPDAAAMLLAARAAGCFMNMLPHGQRAEALEDPAIPLFARLAGETPPLAQLTACWRLLAEAANDTGEAPDLAALQFVQRLWLLAMPTEALLVQGGDERLLLDSASGQNRYLCSPWPQPDVISFSSCTASSISPAALAASEQARQDMFAAAVMQSPDTVLASASDQIVAELLVHFGAEDIAEAVLAASGTDATLLLTGLLAAERPRQTMTTVLMSPAETGSGVPDAVQGRHFASCTASGTTVEKGGAVDGFPPGLAIASIALRTEDGLPRPAEAIAAGCEAAIEAGSRRGHVVLHAIDGSKTGLAAPSLLALDLLADRFGSKLDIVIDACQLRIEPETVRLYLERGWPVLVTGSKFFGAPGFCGAILFPRARLRRIAGGGGLPDGLGAYTSVADGSLSRRCPGLLLRWAASLAHMREFARIPTADICRAIDLAGAKARSAMMRHPELHLVQAPRPRIGRWSHRPSVLTFALRGPEGFLSAAALRPFYVAMAGDCSDTLQTGAGNAARALAARPCRLGQPVQLGGPDIGGLRVAFSAAQIAAQDDLRPSLATAFDKIAMLLRRGRLLRSHA